MVLHDCVQLPHLSNPQSKQNLGTNLLSLVELENSFLAVPAKSQHLNDILGEC